MYPIFFNNSNSPFSNSPNQQRSQQNSQQNINTQQYMAPNINLGSTEPQAARANHNISNFANMMNAVEGNNAIPTNKKKSSSKQPEKKTNKPKANQTRPFAQPCPYIQPINTVNSNQPTPYIQPMNTVAKNQPSRYTQKTNLMNQYVPQPNPYAQSINTVSSNLSYPYQSPVHGLNSYPAHEYIPPAIPNSSLPIEPIISTVNSNHAINNNNANFERWRTEKKATKSRTSNPGIGQKNAGNIQTIENKKNHKKVDAPSIRHYSNISNNCESLLEHSFLAPSVNQDINIKSQKKFGVGSINFYDDLLSKDKNCQDRIIRKPNNEAIKQQIKNRLNEELGWTDWQFFIASNMQQAAIDALDNDSNLLFAKDKLGRTAMHIAIEWKQEAIFDWLLLFGEVNAKSGKGKFVNLRDCLGRSPLHIAAQINCTSMANKLLKAEANINLLDRKGNTPLQIAISNSSAQMADLLAFGQLSTHSQIVPAPATLSNPSLEIILCSITGDVMREPVVLSKTGQTYDKEAIVQWLHNHDTCPISGEKLYNNHELVPNYAIKSYISQLQENGSLREHGLLPSSEISQSHSPSRR